MSSLLPTQIIQGDLGAPLLALSCQSGWKDERRRLSEEPDFQGSWEGWAPPTPIRTHPSQTSMGSQLWRADNECLDRAQFLIRELRTGLAWSWGGEQTVPLG